MTTSTITVDPAKINEKINWYRDEIERLKKLLITLESLREFSTDGNGVAGRVRPIRNNPIEITLEKFIEEQEEPFNYTQLKEAAGNPSRKDLLRAAIDSLEDRGILRVVEKAVGRNPGKYKGAKAE